MTLKEQDQLLLQSAIQQTAKFFSVVKATDPDFTAAEILRNTAEKFRTNQRRISSIQILEIADWEFQVKVNGHAEETFLIEMKGGEDACE